jgi:hypothetical protein
VQRSLAPDDVLWYRRRFTVPEEWEGRRVWLRFGAVDWEAHVTVNGHRVGEHRGGYDPFGFDVTAALAAGENELLVRVTDPTDAGTQPRGKQVQQPHGIWYTSTTGIWQTVWLEPVPETHVQSVIVTPDVTTGRVRVGAIVADAEPGATLEVVVRAAGEECARSLLPLGPGDVVGAEVELTLPLPLRPWSPASPFLYDLELVAAVGDSRDRVQSYFGLRSVSLSDGRDGPRRILLNGEPLFQLGTLDQGFWPDGLYTPPSDAAMKYDLEALKRYGFNMLRKHVKVEPLRYYYWCDVLGLLVWQDMPSGDRSIGPDDADLARTPASAEQFEREWHAIVTALCNHPSIVMWVPFNEGWGQFDTCRIVELTRQWDATRLVDGASGWTDRGCGDVADAHVYPGPGMPRLDRDRAAVLGEFGGLGLPLEGHTWVDKGNWGYRSYGSKADLTAAYVELIDRLRLLIPRGLSAAVYTQTTDVEIEVNGLLTYDRAVLKVDPEAAAAAHRRLFGPLPRLQFALPASDGAPRRWAYTTEEPAAGWEQPEFDDSSWRQGDGGFGRRGTPGAVVRTPWETPAIWLRQAFLLAPQDVEGNDLALFVHHDEDAEVYLDGRLVADLDGYTTDYVIVPLEAEVRRSLREGTHVLAVHCRQTTGGQYVDAGLVRVIEPTGR